MQGHRVQAIIVALLIGLTGQVIAQQHFEFENTDNNHSMIVSEALLNGDPLPVDDEIGVFTPEGLCAGASVVIEEGAQLGLAAWGDEAQQQGVNGFLANEPFTFLFWDVEIGEEIEAEAEFEFGPEVYVFNGFSVLSLTGEWQDNPEPDIEIDPESLDFGYIEAGETETLSISVSNVGDADLTIQEVVVVGEVGGFSADFEDVVLLSPNDEFNLEVTFAPEEEIEYVGVLTLISDDPDESEMEVLLEGNAIPPQPQIFVSDNAHDFGLIEVERRVEWDFEIRNDGEAPLLVHSVITEGDVFDDDMDDEIELDPGDEHTVIVGFQPVDEGDYQGTVTITSNDIDSPEIEIELTGTGTLEQFPEIGVDPGAIDFGEVFVGDTGNEFLTITNNGRAPLTISDITSDNEVFYSDYAVLPEDIDFHFDYILTDNNHSLIIQSALWDDELLQVGCEIGVIDPRGNCAGATVVEDPEEDLGMAAWGDEARTEEIEGFQARDPFVFVYWDPTTSYEVEAEQNFIMGDNFYVLNGLSIVNLSAEGGAHRIDERTTLINPDEAIEIGVYFEPDEEGDHDGILLIESDDPDQNELEVELSGIGFQLQPDILVEEDSHDFGPLQPGESTEWELMVINTGEAALIVESVETVGEFFSDDQDEGFEVEPDQNHVINVSFAPERVGEYNGTVTITSNDPDEASIEVALSGIGTLDLGVIMVVDPVNLDFGEVIVDDIETRAFTIGNEGDVDLILEAIEPNDHAFWVEYEGQGPHFRFEVTDGNHSLLVTEALMDDDDLAEGDEIGVFTPAGLCAGGVVIINPGAQIGMAAWADEVQSEEIEGFQDGEEFDFRYWDASLRREVHAHADFIQGPEMFALNGVTVIRLDAVEEVGRDDVAELVIEPDSAIEITVFFQPEEATEYNNVLTIFSNDAENPEFEVGLSGVGILAIPEIVVSDLDYNFYDDFMATVVGEAVGWTFPISNQGHADLVVESVVTEGLYFSDDVEDGFVLEPDQSRDVTIWFAPEEAGEFDGTTTIISNDPNNGELVIELHGVGVLPPPEIFIEDDSHDFGELLVGMQGEWRLVIRNQGDSELVIQDINTVGDYFHAEFEGEFVLQPDESAVIIVTFLPEEAGVFMGQITIRSNDPENEEVQIRLLGEGLWFPIIAGEEELDFGEVGIGEMGEMFYTIQNNGLESLVVENAFTEDEGFFVEFEVEPREFDWEFEVSDNNMSIIVEEARIDGEMLVPGDYAGVFTENGLCAGYRQVEEEGFPIGVAAWGDQPNDETIDGFLANEEISFRLWDSQAGREWSADIEVVDGEMIYAINGFAVVRLEADRPLRNFAPDDIAEMVIGAGESQDIRVMFEPDEAREYQGSMTILSDDPYNGEFNVDLRGDGVSLPPQIVISDLAHDFGHVLLGDAPEWVFTISNEGVSELVIDGVVTEGDYYSDNIDQPLHLERDATQEVTVTFAPEEAGEFAGTVTITSNDEDSPEIVVELSGTGEIEEIPDIALDQESLDFGRLPLGEFIILDLTGINAGTGDLHISEMNIEGDVFSVEFDEEQGVTVPRGGAFEIPVTFEPDEVGLFEGTLTIISDDPDEGELVVTLTGEALPEGNHFIYTITGENMSAIIQEALLDGENLVEDDEIGVFTPAGLCAGAVTIAEEWPVGLSIWGDDPTTDAIDGFDNNEELFWRYWDRSAGREYDALPVYLQGNGNYNTNALIMLTLSARLEEAPVINLSADMHDFGRVPIEDIESWEFTISNLGDAVLVVENVESDNEAFIVDGFDQNVEIQPGGRISVGVNFLPAEAIEYEGNLTITSDDPDNPELIVGLVGQGIQPSPPAIHLSAQEHAFGDVIVNDHATWGLVVSNTGGSVLNVIDIRMTGAAFAIHPDDGFMLGIDESAVLNVTFTPDDEVRFAGQITIFSDDPDRLRSEIALSGNGIAPEYHWNFQITDNNMSLIIQEVTLDNNPMELGSHVGVFTPEGVCAGVSVIEEYPVGLAAWGDDAGTEEVVEGFVDGEEMSFMVWDIVSGHEHDAEARYHVGDGEFAQNGLGILSLAAFIPVEEMHFRGFVITDVNHSLLVQEAVLDEEFLAAGDEVGVFTPGGILAGAEELEEAGNEPFGIAAWGDDRGTPAIDGFVGGDEITFRYWDSDVQREYIAAVEWIEGPEVYEDNGLSMLSLTVQPAGEPDIVVEREHDFGRIHIGDVNSWDMTIENQGEGNLIIEEISGLDEPFSIDFDPVLEIEPGEQVDLAVWFNPEEVRVFDDHLIISSNDLDNPEVWVHLVGTGYAEEGRPFWIDLPAEIEGREGELLEFVVVAMDPENDPIEILYNQNNLPDEAQFVDHEDGTGTFSWDVSYEDAGEYEAIFTLVSGEFEVPASVQITILDVNRGPVVIGELLDVEIPEDFGLLVLPDLDDIIVDPDGDPLEFSVEGIDELNLEIDEENVLSLTPDPNYFGSSQVTITANDNRGEMVVMAVGRNNGLNLQANRAFENRRILRGVEQYVEQANPSRDDSTNVEFNVDVVPVNDDPEWVEYPERIEVDEGALIEFTVRAEDIDDDDLRLSMQRNGLPDEAQFVDNGDGTGYFSWQTGFVGAGNYNPGFTASDGQAEDVIEVVIIVNNVNRAPVINEPSDEDVFAVRIDEGQELVVNFGAVDPDEDGLNWSVADEADLPEGWSFFDNDTNTAVFTWTPSFDDGRQEAYSPIFEVIDHQGGSDVIQLDITVDDVNRDPVINEPTEDDQFNVRIAEGEELEIDFAAFDLDNDGLAWSVLDEDDLPEGWVFEDNEDNTAMFAWTPSYDDGRQEPYSPVFMVNDDRNGNDQIQVNISVGINEPPYITEPTEEGLYQVDIDEGRELAINFSAEDLENDPLGWSMDDDDLPEGWEFIDNEDRSATFIWTPGFQDARQDAYMPTFTVTDNRGGEDAVLVLITVNDINQAPEVVEPIGAIEIAEDSGENRIADLDDVFADPDGDELEYDVVVVEDLSFRLEDGHILWIEPSENFNGASQVFVTADDRPEGNRVQSITLGRRNDEQPGQLSSNRSLRSVREDYGLTPNRDLETEHEFTLTVTPENDDPEWVEVPARIRVNEGEMIEFDVRADDPDLQYEGDDLTLEVIDWDGTDNLNADFEINNEVSGTYMWDTEVGHAGVYNVVFQVEDDAGADDLAEVVIEVQSVIPFIFEPTEEDVYEINFEEGIEGGILFGADDNDHDPEELRWAIDPGDLPDGWEFEDILDGSAEFFWTPELDAGREDPYIAIFTVSDPDGNTDDIEVRITVDDDPQEPVIVQPSDQDEWDVDVNEGVELTINFRADDLDQDDVLVWSVADPGDLPDGWQFNDNEDRTARFTWTPAFDDGREDPYDVLFQVEDPLQLTDELLVHITVNDVNRPPVVRQGQEIEDIVVDEDVGFQVIVDLDNVFEELDEGDAIEGYEIQGDPQELNMDIDDENVLSYHPDDNYNIPGGVMITVIARDESGLPGQDEFMLTINPINDPPGGGNGQDGFDLLLPESGTVLDDFEATFSWEAAVDVDNDDVLYSVFVFVEHEGRDSTVQVDDLVETEYFVEGLDTVLMNLGIWETEVQATWWVSATDGELVNESNQRWTVTLPEVSSAPIDENGLPLDYSLEPVYPNPFNPSATIDFTVPRSVEVHLSVWDASGRRVGDLISGEVAAGRHVIQWNADGMTAGIYIFTLEAGGRKYITKGVLIR